MSLAEAYDACTQLASSHYENFPVGKLVPRAIRPHVHAVYAFARTADDIADENYDGPEPPTVDERLDQMHHYQALLEDCLLGKSVPESHQWIFLPLADTIERFRLPPQLFRALLSAFEQDIFKKRYADFPEVLDYCQRSANPVGRLVLYLHGHREEEAHALSDSICTGLQLANFWQDVSVDLKKDRIYLPEADRREFGVSEADLKGGRASSGFRDLMRHEVDRTWTYFREGENLSRRLSPLLAWEIRLTWLGGTTILRKIEKLGYNTLEQRPSIQWYDGAILLPHAWFTK